MSFKITSRKFFDEFTGIGGGGVDYLNGLQGDKITCEIEGYFFWAIENQKFVFNAANQTITFFYSAVSGIAQGYGFINSGFNVGDTITITNAGANNGNHVIASVTDRVITTVGALTNGTSNSASIYGVTTITDLDFYYDLIPNKSSKSDFVSATDTGTIQKYSATGLDASVVTPVPLKIATNSFGWVTDIVTGEDGEGFVEGVSIANFKQSFKVTHVFYMTRMWTKDLLGNFLSRTAPSEYQSGSHLKHVFQVDGKFDECDPIINHTGSVFKQNGESGWFNQNNCQTKSEYTLTSIQYQNFATSEFLTQIDGSIVNLVTLSIYSRSGKFVAGTTEFILNHFLCPTIQSDYIDTDTTLLQNIRLDKRMITMDAGAVNGIEFGTDYQSLTNIQATFVDANYVAITFRVDYSSATKDILKLKTPDDRYYSFVVSCQDVAITTTKNIDRVNVLADFNIADFDLRNPIIFGLVDYIHCFKFPNYGTFEDNNIVGFEGDPAYVEIPFWIETAVVNGITPTLKNISCKIVSTKTDEDDFVIEEKVFDTSVVRKLNDKQTIDIETTRGFIFADDNPFNRADLVRYEDGDVGTKIAYKLRYAFALRYETWLEVVQASTGLSYDVFKDIEEVVQAWKRYSIDFGWELKFRMDAQVEGYDGFVTNFQTETDYEILEEGDTTSTGIDFKPTIKYYNEAGDETEGTVFGTKIRVVARFGGDPTIFPVGMTEFTGFMFADDEFGGIFTRKIASLDFDSEEGSPFSTEDLPVLNGVVSEVVANNLRMTIFANRVELDAWVIQPEFTSTPNFQVNAKLNYQAANVLLQENGNAILQEDNFFILL